MCPLPETFKITFKRSRAVKNVSTTPGARAGVSVHLYRVSVQCKIASVVRPISDHPGSSGLAAMRRGNIARKPVDVAPD